MSPNRQKHRAAFGLSSEQIERRQAFQRTGKTEHSISDRNVDEYTGGKGVNPWRCIRGASGYFGMQIDNRPGVACRHNEEEETVGA